MCWLSAFAFFVGPPGVGPLIWVNSCERARNSMFKWYDGFFFWYQNEQLMISENFRSPQLLGFHWWILMGKMVKKWSSGRSPKMSIGWWKWVKLVKKMRFGAFLKRFWSIKVVFDTFLEDLFFVKNTVFFSVFFTRAGRDRSTEIKNAPNSLKKIKKSKVFVWQMGQNVTFRPSVAWCLLFWSKATQKWGPHDALVEKGSFWRGPLWFSVGPGWLFTRKKCNFPKNLF